LIFLDAVSITENKNKKNHPKGWFLNYLFPEICGMTHIPATVLNLPF